MARTLKIIQDQIATALKAQFSNLSSSAVAEWRLLSYVVAVAIYSFEIIMDQFRTEMENKTQQITPATERWYAEMCRRYQHGHELAFDNSTAMYYYKTDDPTSRIAKIVAVADRNGQLSIKVAKLDANGAVKPFEAEELSNFTGYIEAIHVVGSKYAIISTTPDALRYNVEVFYDPIQPRSAIELRVKSALETFKSSIGFNGILYAQRLTDAILHCDGVLTVNMITLERKGATDVEFTPLGAWHELHAGYFDYDKDSVLTLIMMPND